MNNRALLPIVTVFVIVVSVVKAYCGVGINYNYGSKAPLGLGVFYRLSEQIAIGTNVAINSKVFDRTATQPNMLFDEDILTGSFTTAETIVMNLLYTPFVFTPAAVGFDIGAGIAFLNHYDTYKENKSDNHYPLYFNSARYKTADSTDVLPVINISAAILSRPFFFSTGYSFFVNELTVRFGYGWF